MMTTLQSLTLNRNKPLFKKLITKIGEFPVFLGLSVLSSTSQEAKGILETRTKMLQARYAHQKLTNQSTKTNQEARKRES